MNFRIRLHALLALIISASSLLGQDEVAESLTEALAKTKVDLEKAIATLDKTRAAIAAEKPKFSGEFNEVEQQLREKRRLLRIARMGKRTANAKFAFCNAIWQPAVKMPTTSPACSRTTHLRFRHWPNRVLQLLWATIRLFSSAVRTKPKSSRTGYSSSMPQSLVWSLCLVDVQLKAKPPIREVM